MALINGSRERRVRRRFEDLMLLDLKTEEGAISQSIRVLPLEVSRQGNRFSLSLQKEHSSADTFFFF